MKALSCYHNRFFCKGPIGLKCQFQGTYGGENALFCGPGANFASWTPNFIWSPAPTNRANRKYLGKEKPKSNRLTVERPDFTTISQLRS